MEPEIVPADKRLRWISLAVGLVLSIAGLTALAALRAELEQIEKVGEQDRPAAAARVLRLTRICAWVGGVGFVGAGAWLWRLGRKINRSGRYPPPGMKVVRQTRTKTGPAARAAANLAELAAFLSIVVGTIGMWYLYRCAEKLLR